MANRNSSTSMRSRTRAGTFIMSTVRPGRTSLICVRFGGRCDQRGVQPSTRQESIMGLRNEKIEALSFVTAELNYLSPLPGRPRTYTYDPPAGEPQSNV